MNYVIDCYTINANSALAATMFIRSFFGAGFPLFAGSMYQNLGVSFPFDLVYLSVTGESADSRPLSH